MIFQAFEILPVEYIYGTSLVDKDFRHHEIGNDNEDNHKVILVDGVDAFDIFVYECYGRKTPWRSYVDTVDINIFDGVEITLLGLTR